jgi:predicted PurR-regulated permease PerM
MAIYMFSTQDTITASLFAGWMIVVVMTDNVLTPLLMGRGSSVPMLVIFIGTIGGFMAIGFLGLFMGAVTLSIAYKLFVAWLNEGGES